IKQHQFREDLFHRLNVMQFRPPPLRERGGDILILAQYFLNQFALRLGKQLKSVSEPARQALLTHSWPGNVRELRNVVERAVILETTPEIQATSLPDFEVESRLREQTGGLPAAGRHSTLSEALVEFERQLIINALAQHGHNLGQAAQQL